MSNCLERLVNFDRGRSQKYGRKNWVMYSVNNTTENYKSKLRTHFTKLDNSRFPRPEEVTDTKKQLQRLVMS